MNDEFDSAELQLLFSEMRDTTITPDRLLLLESILSQFPQARSQWFLFCDIETGLKDWAVTEDERRQSNLPFVSTRNRAYSLRPMALATFAALVFIAIALVFLIVKQAIPPTNDELTQTETLVDDVAVLTHAVDVEWTEGVGMPTGTTLGPSLISLQSGAVLIEFFSGATVVLEGPAEFELLSTNKGRLLSGKLNAHVPPQAHGFIVETTVGEIVDHGTDFGVKMPDGDQHELHVFAGKVAVVSDSYSIEVQTGEAIRLGLADSEVFDADRSSFLIEHDLIQQSRLAAERRMAQWKDSIDTLSTDSATLYHLRLDMPYESHATQSRALVNSAQGSDNDSGGSIVGSQWVAGRWPAKSAILFGGPGDRIRMTISSSMTSMTLIAWVNVQSLPRWQNSLLSADSDEPGSIHWQLTKRGQLRLAIARDLGRPSSDWEAVESEPFLNESQHRQWMMLVTTFDGSTIRHYANGRLVGSGASFTPESIHIGTAEIGNWLGDTRRELHAILDEFAVMNRALNEEEILAIYRNGQP